MTSRFHNISDAELADMLGQQDAKAKTEIAELDALKAEFKARKGRDDFTASGHRYTVTIADEISNRIDSKKVREKFGAKAAQFETTTISTVLRVKPKAAWLSTAA